MWPWIVDPGREPADESSSSSESDAYGEDESVSDESESRPASSGVLVDTFFAARRDWSWYLQGTCDRIRGLRERSEAHVETDDKRTWLPYGMTETRVLAEAVTSCLSRREALGAAPLRELQIGIMPPRNRDILEAKADPQSPEDYRRDDEYLERHLPHEPPETRLVKLLEGQVENLEAYWFRA